MRGWIKLYTEIAHDRKMCLLTDRQFRTCINLFALAGIVDEDGILPPVADIAYQLRIDEPELLSDMQALVDADILKELGGDFILSHWHRRQAKPPSASPEAILERVHRFRAKKRNDDVTPLQNVTKSVTSVTTRERGEEKREEEKRREEEEREGRPTAPCIEAFLQARGGAVNGMDIEKLRDLEETHGTENTIRAIEHCNANRRQSFLSIGYIEATLSGWQRDGTAPTARKNGTGPRKTTRNPSPNGKEWIYTYIDDGSEEHREPRTGEDAW